MTDNSYNKIMVINAGSSSLRLALFACKDGIAQLLAEEHYTTKSITPETALGRFLSDNPAKGNMAFAHRVVHGGAAFKSATLIDETVKTQIRQLEPLAPLHNPYALELIERVEAMAPGARQIAAFDTAFFRDLPARATTYAIPAEIRDKYSIQRFGFHGLAHQYMWQQWCKLTSREHEQARLITIQLGSGCSICAIRNGDPLDTSMGFSPLEGLVMASRSGDIDPGILIYLQTVAGMSARELDELLNQQSGLLGLSGKSADIRKLLTANDQASRLALDVYVYRLQKYIGAYLVALGGADAIVFGGGVGENSARIRAAVLNNLQWCGVQLDAQRNEEVSASDGCFSLPESMIEAWTIQVNEAQIIAEQSMQILSRA